MTSTGSRATPQRLRVKFAISYPSGTEGHKELTIPTAESIGEIKALNFAEEIANGSTVRFLFQGRLLEDSKSLGSYCEGHHGLMEGSTIIAHLTRHSPLSTAGAHGGAAAEPLASSQEGLGSLLFYATVGILLCYAWYWRLSSPSIFDSFSEISLVVFTCIWGFVVGAFAVDEAKGLYRRLRLHMAQDSSFVTRIPFTPNCGTTSQQASGNRSSTDQLPQHPWASSTPSSLSDTAGSTNNNSGNYEQQRGTSAAAAAALSRAAAAVSGTSRGSRVTERSRALAQSVRIARSTHR